MFKSTHICMLSICVYMYTNIYICMYINVCRYVYVCVYVYRIFMHIARARIKRTHAYNAPSHIPCGFCFEI